MPLKLNFLHMNLFCYNGNMWGCTYKYVTVVGKLEWKRPLGRPMYRWEDNIKMAVEEAECECMTLDRIQWRALASMEISLQFPCKVRNFLTSFWRGALLDEVRSNFEAKIPTWNLRPGFTIRSLWCHKRLETVHWAVKFIGSEYSFYLVFAQL